MKFVEFLKSSTVKVGLIYFLIFQSKDELIYVQTLTNLGLYEGFGYKKECMLSKIVIVNKCFLLFFENPFYYLNHREAWLEKQFVPEKR